MTAREELAGLIDCTLPEELPGLTHQDVQAAADAILAAGWRPPMTDSETERPQRCPVLTPEGDLVTEGRQCQQYEGHPHDHTWFGDNGHAYSTWSRKEQQPSPGPGCYPPADGWDGVSITEDREQQSAIGRAHDFLGGPALTTDAELRALTPDQMEKCVHRALKARDVQAVEGYLLLMALKDPGRAQLLMDTMKVGLNLAKEHQP